MPKLGALTSILPPPTLAWKLRLLAEGCRYMEGRCAPLLPRGPPAACCDRAVSGGYGYGSLARQLPQS